MGIGGSKLTVPVANNGSENVKRALTAYNAALRNAKTTANLAAAINKNTTNANGSTKQIGTLIKNAINKYGRTIYAGHAAAAEAAAAAAAGAPPPVAPINNAAKRLEALNAYYANKLVALANNNARATQYLANRMNNYNKNKNANSGGKYASLWARVNAKRAAPRNNFTPSNQNINASNPLIGYKLQANGSYIKVQRSAANAANWARANGEVYNRNATGKFTPKPAAGN